MATKSVGTLAAKLVLDTQLWTAGFGKAKATAASFTSRMATAVGARVTGIATSLATAGAAAVTTAVSVHTLAKSFETIDRQAKLADRLGITVGQTQKLALAADLAGTDVETLAKAMLHMGRTMGSGGMSMDKRFFQVADSIAKIKDPAERAEKAFKAFGKGGMELINLLAQGGKGIMQSAAAIDRFGLALSRVDAEKVEEANDAWTVMKTVLTGVVNKVAVAFAPIITSALNRILTLMEGVTRSLGRAEGWQAFAMVASSSLESTIRLAALLTSQFIAAASAVNLLERGLLAVRFAATGFTDKSIASDIIRKKAEAGELGRLNKEALGIAFGVNKLGTGGGAGGGGFGGRLGGDIGGITSPKTQGALERGSKEAAVAILGLKGDDNQKPITKEQGDKLIALMTEQNRKNGTQPVKVVRL